MARLELKSANTNLTTSQVKQLSPDIFELTIMPTEQCNFRCTYCYEDFAIGRMSEETVSAVRALVKAKIKIVRGLHLSWFGGEPLVAKDLVLSLTEEFGALCHKKNKKFKSGMTTNGYHLSPELFSALLDAGNKNFQISLDGPEIYHNKTRIMASGRGSFERIWANIDAMQRADQEFLVHLRLHLTALNIADFEEWALGILERFLGDKRFNVSFTSVIDHGGPIRKADVIPVYAQAAAIIKRLNAAKNEKLGISIDSTRANYVCYAAKPHAIVVRADGSLAKCTVHFRSTNNQVGKLNASGKMITDVEKLTKWSAGVMSGRSEELSCPAHYLKLT